MKSVDAEGFSTATELSTAEFIPSVLAGTDSIDTFDRKSTAFRLTRFCQALLRHTTPMTTLGVYVQELPESVRTAVEALDQKLCGPATAGAEALVQ